MSLSKLRVINAKQLSGRTGTVRFFLRPSSGSSTVARALLTRFCLRSAFLSSPDALASALAVSLSTSIVLKILYRSLFFHSVFGEKF
jgi:hypothetical protein